MKKKILITGETILMVHGFSADKGNWVRFSKFITPLFHVVAIDLPGFGSSSKIKTESYNIKSQVERFEKITAPDLLK